MNNSNEQSPEFKNPLNNDASAGSETGDSRPAVPAEEGHSFQEPVDVTPDEKREVTRLERFGIPMDGCFYYLEDGTVVERPVTRQKGVEEFDPWRMFTTCDAFKDEGAEPPWVIKGLLMTKSATIVSAQPKAMKSLSLLQACMEAVATEKVWGKCEAPGVKRSLFIETEDTRQLLNARVRGLSKGLGLKPGQALDGFHYACVGPFRLIDEEERLSKLFDQYEPDFAVISTLQNILGERDWNSQQNMQPIMEIIIKLARQCPLFLVTHSPQDKKQKRAAGTITQAANFASALHYYEKKVLKGKTTIQVRVDSKAGVVMPEFSLRLETEGPAGDPEGVRRLVFDGEGKRSTKEIVKEAREEAPNITVDELMELTGTGKRNVQKVLLELNDRQKRAS
jgi:hypothetical protein